MVKPVSDDIWFPQIAEQLLAIMPRPKEHPNCIDPASVPAFYNAAQLLERLGYVEITNNGIRQLDRPRGVQSKTRWDDAYHLFLLCLQASQLIVYSPIDREAVIAMAESYGVAEEDLDPEVNDAGWIEIAGTAHTCDATIHPSILASLEKIGLVETGHWTGPAIPILWRIWANMHPTERPADTQLFQEYTDMHFATVPAEIADELQAALSISEDLLERKRVMLAGQDDEEEVWRLAGQSRMMDLEFLFSQRWRFYDGWLTLDQMRECLFFGFDGLAAEIAHIFATKKNPNSDVGRAMRQTPDVRPQLH